MNGEGIVCIRRLYQKKNGNAGNLTAYIFHAINYKEHNNDH